MTESRSPQKLLPLLLVIKFVEVERGWVNCVSIPMIEMFVLLLVSLLGEIRVVFWR
jgi:hypothetical protein